MKSAILQSISSITCDWAEKIGLFAILLNLFRLYTVKSKAASPVALGFVRNKNWTKRISCFIVVRGTGVVRVVRGTGVLTTFENSFNVLTKTYNSYRIIAVVLSTLAKEVWVVNTPVPLTSIFDSPAGQFYSLPANPSNILVQPIYFMTEVSGSYTLTFDNSGTDGPWAVISLYNPFTGTFLAHSPEFTVSLEAYAPYIILLCKNSHQSGPYTAAGTLTIT